MTRQKLDQAAEDWAAPTGRPFHTASSSLSESVYPSTAEYHGGGSVQDTVE
jgi:hypothetical protein